MRARNIKPGFYRNEQLALCSPMARLLFPGLWMLADRQGRLEDRPMRIRIQVFPYDAVNIESLLKELEKHGLIKRYIVDGQRLIWVINFNRHQNPHKNEKESILPAPDDSGASVMRLLGKPETKPADSLLLTPETLNLKPEKRAGSNSVPLPDWLPESDWEDFCEMRRRILVPMTPRATELLLQKLVKLRDAGHDPALTLQQSIINSWKSVFPLTGVNNEKYRPTASKHERAKAAFRQSAADLGFGFAPDE